MTSTDHNDPRRLIVFGVLTSVAAIVFVLLLYQVRGILLLAYVSALFAMGISPLVQIIERRRLLPIGPRLPRWLAILIIYAAIIAAVVAIGAVVIPPLIDQAEELWRTLPETINQAQAQLVRLGILRRPITLGEAVQQTENTVLVPKIMGRQVGLSAVTVIIALGVGSQLLGVVGAILSVPTAAIIQVLVQELITHDA